VTVPAGVAVPRGDSSTWATPLDTTLLATLVQACLYAPADPRATTVQRGQRLEDLMSWLIAHLPGFVVRQRNVWSASRAQEVDLVVWNEQHPAGFASFGNKILVECKNTGYKVDSSDVAWFDWKLRLGGVDEGILVAARGITGDPQLRTAAHDIIMLANVEKRHIMVVQLDDIARLTCTEDLRNLLIDSQLGLATRS